MGQMKMQFGHDGPQGRHQRIVLATVLEGHLGDAEGSCAQTGLFQQLHADQVEAHRQLLGLLGIAAVTQNHRQQKVFLGDTLGRFEDPAAGLVTFAGRHQCHRFQEFARARVPFTPSWRDVHNKWFPVKITSQYFGLGDKVGYLNLLRLCYLSNYINA